MEEIKLTEDEISLRFKVDGIVQYIRQGKVTDSEAKEYILNLTKPIQEQSIPLSEVFEFNNWTNLHKWQYDWDQREWVNENNTERLMNSELFNLYQQSKLSK